MRPPIHIAILASGKGGNAAAIISAAQKPDTNFIVSNIITNNKNAGVLEIAEKFQIPSRVISNEALNDCSPLIQSLQKNNISLLVLAGFLKKIPPALIHVFKNRILNIHPALLPKYGGKGMYGHHIHETVLKNKETESGITIHLVDEIYDHGKILFQAKCSISENETPQSLAQKIQTLEHRFYWQEINKFVTNMQTQKLEYITKTFPLLVAGLQPNQTGVWGKMNAWQMVEHISEIFKVSAGLIHYPLETPAEYLPKYKEFLWSEKPFKENTKAPVSFVGEEPPVVKETSFQKAITALNSAIAAFEHHFKHNPAATTLHPSFGELNFEEWIQIHHKHLLHHAKQFGL